MKHFDLLITNATIRTAAGRAGSEHPDAYLGTRDGLVAEIGSMADLGEHDARETLDADGQWLLPGLIDTHTHAFQSFAKGLGADHELVEWLSLGALPYGELMTPRHQELSARLTAMEALKSGCTTLTEFFYTAQDPELADGCIRGLESTGIRSVFIRTFQDRGEEYGMPASFIEPAARAMDEVSRLRRDYRDRGDMLSIWTGPDVTWSTSRAGYQTMLEYCLAEDVRYATHIDETLVDNAMTTANYGMPVVPMLEQLGFLTDKMLAVHCVNLDADEIRAFAANSVSVSYNPVSNMYLGSGVAPVPALLEAGVTVSLGTDGAASNNATDMLECLKFGALIQKGFTRAAAALSAAETLDLATVGGAAALGMGDRLGTLAVGMKADAVVFDARHLKSTPVHDIAATVVYSSSPENIAATIVDGRVVYRDGAFTTGVEEAELLAEIDAEISALKARAAALA